MDHKPTQFRVHGGKTCRRKESRGLWEFLSKAESQEVGGGTGCTSDEWTTHFASEFGEEKGFTRR